MMRRKTSEEVVQFWTTSF